MKKIKYFLVVLLCGVSFLTCENDPFGGGGLKLLPDSVLFASAFSQYNEFLNESEVITKTDEEAMMVTKLGEDIKNAAQKWCVSVGKPHYLDDYEWEYNLVKDDQVNAWCMPGGKIVVYTGILPVTQNRDALATVMGHEVAHALHNHGNQRVSLNLLTQLGLIGAQITVGMLGASEETQAILMTGLGITTTLGVALPFSRDNETEADKTGLYLMAIAGYNPEESVPFWQRMAKLGGGTPEFLSTHPSSANRVKNLQKLIPEAKKKAIEINGQ